METASTKLDTRMAKALSHPVRVQSLRTLLEMLEERDAHRRDERVELLLPDGTNLDGHRATIAKALTGGRLGPREAGEGAWLALRAQRGRRASGCRIWLAPRVSASVRLSL